MATRAQLPHLSIAINSLVTMRIYVQCNLAMKVYISVKKLYKLYKHDHLEGLYPLQSKICRSPNQTVQWELPVPIYHHICHQNSSNMFSVFFQFQLGLDQSLQNRPWIWIVNLAHRSTDTDCTCKFWCRLWTMWTMWTWVNSDIYGLFNWCSWPLWRNMPVRSSKMQNFDRPQWAMSCLQGLQISASGRIPGQKLPMNSLPVPRRSDDLPWPGTKMHQDAPRNVFPSTDFYHNHL